MKMIYVGILVLGALSLLAADELLIPKGHLCASSACSRATQDLLESVAAVLAKYRRWTF